MQPRYNAQKTAELKALINANLFLVSDAMALVAAGADPNIVDNDRDQNTLLHKLVDDEDNEKIIEELVKKYGADIHQTDAYDDTPLASLMNSNSFNVKNAMMLLTLGASKDTKSHIQESVLHKVMCAIVENKLSVVKRLITEFKIDVDIQMPVGGVRGTPLSYLIESVPYEGKLDLIKFLIESGANPKVLDMFHSSALHYAAASGDIEVARWLVKQKKMDINGKDRLGRTPLFLACHHGQLDMAKWLVTSGASFKVKTGGNHTLMHAASFSGDLDTMLWLIQSGEVDLTYDSRLDDPLLFSKLSAADKNLVKPYFQTAQQDKKSIALFKQKHDLSLEHSGIFASIKKWWSKMRNIFAMAAKLMKKVTMAEVKAHAAANPSSRTAHILKVMNSKMTAADFKKEYEAARKKQWFHNPFETTMRDRLAALTGPEDLDMAIVQDHAIKRPDSLTAQILTLSLKP